MFFKGRQLKTVFRSLIPKASRGRISLIAVLIILVLMTVERIGCLNSSLQDDWSRYHQKSFTVVKVVDGDTLDIDIGDGGKSCTRIRLWGVDTPETKHPNKGVGYYGPEAAAYTTRRALNQKVNVVLEPFKNTRGKYGRLLAYLYLPDGNMLNEELIAQGYGYADPRFDHVLKTRFGKLQEEARKNQIGLWKNLPPDHPDQLPHYIQNR